MSYLKWCKFFFLVPFLAKKGQNFWACIILGGYEFPPGHCWSNGKRFFLKYWKAKFLNQQEITNIYLVALLGRYSECPFCIVNIQKFNPIFMKSIICICENKYLLIEKTLENEMCLKFYFTIKVCHLFTKKCTQVFMNSLI